MLKQRKYCHLLTVATQAFGQLCGQHQLVCNLFSTDSTQLSNSLEGRSNIFGFSTEGKIQKCALHSLVWLLGKTLFK